MYNSQSRVFLSRISSNLLKSKIPRKTLLLRRKTGKRLSIILLDMIRKTVIATWTKNYFSKGSGCGSVGWVVTYDSRCLLFESSRRQNIFVEQLLSAVLKRRKWRKKRTGNAHFLKIFYFDTKLISSGKHK